MSHRTTFARTLNEAFPRTPEYGCAITRYKRTDWGQIAVYAACAVGAVAAVLALVFN